MIPNYSANYQLNFSTALAWYYDMALQKKKRYAPFLVSLYLHPLSCTIHPSRLTELTFTAPSFSTFAVQYSKHVGICVCK